MTDCTTCNASRKDNFLAPVSDQTADTLMDEAGLQQDLEIFKKPAIWQVASV